MKNKSLVTNFFLIGIIVSSLVVSPYVIDFTLISRFITLSVMLFLTVFVMYRQGLSFTLKLDLPLFSYMAYTLFCCCSILWATNTAESIFENSKLLLSLIVFLLTVFSLKLFPAQFFIGILKFSVVLFLIEFTVGIIQFTDIEHLEKSTLYELTGLNGHKNLFSSFLLLNLFFLINAIFKLSKPWKIAAGICIILNLCVILFLKTKAVWIGISISIVIFMIISVSITALKKIKFKVNMYAIIAGILIIANVFFLKTLPVIINKGIEYNKEVNAPDTKTIRPELDDERLVLWKKTYHVIHQHLIKGVGIGNWQIHYPDATLANLWRAEDLNYTFQRPHNDFLWILSETGLIGFNLFLLFIVSIIFLLFKAAANITHNKQLRYEVILCAAMIAGYFSASFFDFPKERIEHLMWLSILLGYSYYLITQHFTLNSFRDLILNKNVYMITGCILFFITGIGLIRYKGEFYLRKMYHYKNQAQYIKVIETCKQATGFAYTIDPTSVPISWYSGNAQAAQGNYGAAIEDFKTAYRLNPYNRNVLNDLASAYAFNNNMNLAKKYYEESARISPRFDDPKLNLAALYMKEGNYKMANFWLHALHHPSERRTNYQKIVDINLGYLH
ncbi:MAG: O-antigen ligase family protein [Bacteroidota bacterium]